jgi:hypothetical protein
MSYELNPEERKLNIKSITLSVVEVLNLEF